MFTSARCCTPIRTSSSPATSRAATCASGARRARRVVEVVDDELTICHRTLDHVRWTRVRVDVGGASDETRRAGARRGGAARQRSRTPTGGWSPCRIEIGGITSGHGALVRERERLDSELRGLATDLGAEQVWLERIDWQTARAAFGDGQRRRGRRDAEGPAARR